MKGCYTSCGMYVSAFAASGCVSRSAHSNLSVYKNQRGQVRLT